MCHYCHFCLKVHKVSAMLPLAQSLARWHICIHADFNMYAEQRSSLQILSDRLLTAALVLPKLCLVYHGGKKKGFVVFKKKL